MPCQSPLGMAGDAHSLKPLDRSALAMSQPNTPAVSAAMASAASGAGSTFRRGRRGHSSSTVMVSTPTATAWLWLFTIWFGSSMRLSTADFCDCPPSTTWSCDRAMTTPTPASMPWTTAGETASAVLATLNAPSTSCSTPAARVIMQVARQPYVRTSSPTTRASPAAGPLTCTTDPPSGPATRPPTTAAIRPAMSGAPQVTAMPRERGTATRKTTSEAGRSCLSTEEIRSVLERLRCVSSVMSRPYDATAV